MTNNIAGATTATANGNAGGGGGGGGSATGAAAAQNETSNLFSRKGTVHDLAQVLIEDCQKLIAECHKLMSKYQGDLLLFSNSHLTETVNKDDLRSLRIKCYMTVKANLDKLLPQIDQINYNNSELTSYIHQIIFYLEYLKHQVVRHFYILKEFTMPSDPQSIALQRAATSSFLQSTLFITDAPKKGELFEAFNAIREVENIVNKLCQKYYTFIPDIEDIKVPIKGQKHRGGNSFGMFSKFKYICCLCAPKYI